MRGFCWWNLSNFSCRWSNNWISKSFY